MNLSQNLGDYGQLYLWGNINSYWNSDYKSKNIQAGWNKTFSEFNNIIISTSYNKNTYINNTENILYLSVSVPLSNTIDKNTVYLTNSINYNKSKYNNSTSLYGSALDNKLNYNFYQTVSNNSENKSNLNLRYKANVAEFSTVRLILALQKNLIMALLVLYLLIKMELYLQEKQMILQY